jgi:hypothetical protein
MTSKENWKKDVQKDNAKKTKYAGPRINKKKMEKEKKYSTGTVRGGAWYHATRIQ